MKKKIISLKQFQKQSNIWKKKIYNNQKIKQLKKKLYAETDKLNYSYTHNWLGEPILQTPDDIVTQQEIIFKTQPDVIIETGVCWGGSILFYNMMSKITPIKKIIGIDIFIPKELRNRLKKKCKNKLILLEEDSTSINLIKKIEKIVRNYKNFFVHLDSNHSYEHVLKELSLYSKFLNKNNYIVADDTIVDEVFSQRLYRPRPWNCKKNNNPKTAVKNFLKKNRNFKLDLTLNYNHIISSCPGGYIYKK
tara:strand:- start:588 stop:1334 length:747 start_codon:yes stop_codon:yes gene_type:complete